MDVTGWQAVRRLFPGGVAECPVTDGRRLEIRVTCWEAIVSDREAGDRIARGWLVPVTVEIMYQGIRYPRDVLGSYSFGPKGRK